VFVCTLSNYYLCIPISDIKHSVGAVHLAIRYETMPQRAVKRIPKEPAHLRLDSPGRILIQQSLPRPRQHTTRGHPASLDCPLHNELHQLGGETQCLADVVAGPYAGPAHPKHIPNEQVEFAGLR
jgi:hypothetical protein